MMRARLYFFETHDVGRADGDLVSEARFAVVSEHMILCRWPPGSGGNGRELAGFAPTSVPFEARHDDGNREGPGDSLSPRPG
jgi:hypothetical protein